MKFSTGGAWDHAEWEILFNEPAALFGETPCKHMIESGEDLIVPRVVKAMNEGRYNSTGVCLDCILEAASLLKGAE